MVILAEMPVIFFDILVFLEEKSKNMEAQRQKQIGQLMTTYNFILVLL